VQFRDLVGLLTRNKPLIGRQSTRPKELGTQASHGSYDVTRVTCHVTRAAAVTTRPDIVYPVDPNLCLIDYKFASEVYLVVHGTVRQPIERRSTLQIARERRKL